MQSRNREVWGFEPKSFDTLFLGHARINHGGKIPKMVREGFKGQIVTSSLTAEPREIMRVDVAHIRKRSCIPEEFQAKGFPPDVPVYLYSSLAIKAAAIFRKNKKHYDTGAPVGLGAFLEGNIPMMTLCAGGIFPEDQTDTIRVFQQNLRTEGKPCTMTRP